MLRGLYTVATVLEQNTQSINVMSNNLANANTHGYKRDVALFEEFNSQLIMKMGGSAATGNAANPTVTVENDKEIYTATTSSGYFRVQAPGGVSHNTSVKFRVGEDGTLKTVYLNGNRAIIEGAGYTVLGQKGPIQVGSGALEIDENGTVKVDGQVVDRLVYNTPKGVIGTISGGIKFHRIATDYEQGDLENTENMLDFALTDKGYFAVETPFGEKFARSGRFEINGELELVTAEGYKVLGIDGPIKLTSRDITVNKYGEIAIDGLVVDKFKIVNPSNVERMVKYGGTLFSFVGEMNEQPYEGEIVQGFTEGSNVNTLKEMIQIMEVYRNYESAQRVVRTYDETLDKVVNEVGRV